MGLRRTREEERSGYKGGWKLNLKPVYILRNYAAFAGFRQWIGHREVCVYIRGPLCIYYISRMLFCILLGSRPAPNPHSI